MNRSIRTKFSKKDAILASFDWIEQNNYQVIQGITLLICSQVWDYFSLFNTVFNINTSFSCADNGSTLIMQ